LNVTTVEDFIGASAVLKDNIRTIHPRIHEGILHTGRLSESKLLKEHHIEPIELVFVNLYPFDSVLAASRQNITQALNEFDVGGPALIRSALKNFNGVTVVSSPEDYETVLWHIAKNNEVPMGLKKQLAIKALNHVVNYDKCALDAFYEPETEID
jgi:phosphoribosylaminoimidazolecarboxamide formyltransferase/IMP cyclohydrolase